MYNILAYLGVGIVVSLLMSILTADTPQSLDNKDRAIAIVVWPILLVVMILGALAAVIDLLRRKS